MTPDNTPLGRPRTDKPFNKRERRRLCYQAGFGFRERNDWNSGDLPAPYAEGDLLWLPQGKEHARLHGLGWGYFVVCAGFSIDEGDAWYFRVSNGSDRNSDRLHVAFAERCTWDESVNWMIEFELIDTADPEGLALRKQMLSAGWEGPPPVRKCPTCGAIDRSPVDV